jgi:hypothetical protein
MSRKFGITATVLFSLTVLTLLINGSSQNAVALPANEITTTYYETAAKKTVVGESTRSCDGHSIMDGRKTPHFKRSISPCNSSPRPPEVQLPCEFLVQGCSPFPQKR